MVKGPEKWSDYDTVYLKSTHKPHGGLAATLQTLIRLTEDKTNKQTNKQLLTKQQLHLILESGLEEWIFQSH